MSNSVEGAVTRRQHSLKVFHQGDDISNIPISNVMDRVINDPVRAIRDLRHGQSKTKQQFYSGRKATAEC